MKIVVLTGAGISAESGIKTFRDADGLWEGYDVMEVASPEGWRANSALVLDFYNQRRRQLSEVKPNDAHYALVGLEEKHKVVVITQNVDNLHERAGSKNVIHLHGELTKSRSVLNEHTIFDCPDDIELGDKAPDGGQLRPHIVWFGEQVPMLDYAIKEIADAEAVLIIGTSMQVYPAASLTAYAPEHIPIYYVDPRPTINHALEAAHDLTVIKENASVGVRKVVDDLLNG